MSVGEIGPNQVVTASRDTELPELTEMFEDEQVGAIGEELDTVSETIEAQSPEYSP